MISPASFVSKTLPRRSTLRERRRLERRSRGFARSAGNSFSRKAPTLYHPPRAKSVGLSRRHLLQHLTRGSLTIPGLQFLNQLEAHAGQVRKKQKACILLWMSGGPPTIDMWDLKPGSKNGGEFKPISTAGDLQIAEHLPRTAAVMKHLSVVRSMSTREADHGRGRYYTHTSFIPDPALVHPAFGSVVSYELGTKRKELEIPAFVSIGGG